MADISIQTLIHAAPAHVFALWVDPERMKEWIGGLTRVTDVTGPMDRAGTTYTAWFGRMASRNEVLEVEPGRRLRTRLGNAVLRGITEVTFEPEPEGTRLTQRFSTEGFIPGIAARIFAMGSWHGSFRGELGTFKALAEREAGAR